MSEITSNSVYGYDYADVCRLVNFLYDNIMCVWCYLHFMTSGSTLLHVCINFICLFMTLINVEAF